jgi:hypothetical protein
MEAYPLRNIPDDLWRAVKVRAMTDAISVRDVILLGLQRYAKDGLPALGKAPEKKHRKMAAR